MMPHQINYTSRADGGCNGIDFLCGMDVMVGIVASFADAGRYDDRKTKMDGSKNYLAADGGDEAARTSSVDVGRRCVGSGFKLDADP